MEHNPADILPVRVASGRLGMARRYHEPTTAHEVDLSTAQVAELLRRRFNNACPLETDHLDQIRAVLDDLHRETWTENEVGREAYWSSVRYDENGRRI